MSCGDPNSLIRILDRLASDKEEFLSIIAEACKRHNVKFVSTREHGGLSHEFVGPPTLNDLQWRIDCRELNQRIREISIRPPRLFGMTTYIEQDYYRKAAEDVCEIAGEIVDLGCWLGSTTLSLLHGCESSEQTQNVWAFDNFTWESYMDGMNIHKQKTKKYNVGDSFKQEFIDRVGTRISRINLCEVDLNKYKWNGGKVKLLLVDAMKTVGLMSNIAASFYPSLVPGSILIHQDYKHWYSSWIHCLQYAFRDHFDVEHETSDGSTVSFKLTKPIHDYDLDLATRFHSLLDSDIEDAFEWSKSIVSEAARPQIDLAHIMAYVHTNNEKAANATYERLSKSIDPTSVGFDVVKNSVQNMKP